MLEAFVPNKTEDLNLSFINIIIGINEWKAVTKHISWECNYGFDGQKCNSNQWRNNDKRWCECKKCHVCYEEYVLDPCTCSWKNVKYLSSIADDSEITCDESYHEKTKTFATNFNEKKTVCKM